MSLIEFERQKDRLECPRLIDQIFDKFEQKYGKKCFLPGVSQRPRQGHAFRKSH